MNSTSNLFKSGIRKAYNTMSPDSTNMSMDINTERQHAMSSDIKSVKELPEEKGYSEYLKSDDNPRGETEELTPEVLSQILMKIVSLNKDDKEDEDKKPLKNTPKKNEPKEAMGASSAGGYSQPLFGTVKRKIKEEKIEGGLADNLSIYNLAEKHNVSITEILTQLQKGVKVEMEHTKEFEVAFEIAMDHIFEDVNYYDKLETIEKTKEETKEATTTASSGQYDVPFPSKKRKDPLSIEGPKSIYTSRAVKDKNFPKLGGPGSKYVQVKEKCKTFPYCNQGDINALHIFEKDYIKEAIKNISSKTNLSEDFIKNLIFENLKKKV
jgi:hypothetical protein